MDKIVYGFDDEGNLLGTIPVPKRRAKQRLTVRLAKKSMQRKGAVSFKKEDRVAA